MQNDTLPFAMRELVDATHIEMRSATGRYPIHSRTTIVATLRVVGTLLREKAVALSAFKAPGSMDMSPSALFGAGVEFDKMADAIEQEAA